MAWELSEEILRTIVPLLQRHSGSKFVQMLCELSYLAIKKNKNQMTTNRNITQVINKYLIEN